MTELVNYFEPGSGASSAAREEAMPDAEKGLTGFRCLRCRIPSGCPFRSVPGLAEKMEPLVEWHWYDKGRAVVRQGERLPGIYILHSGWLRLYSRTEQGRRLAVGLSGPGTILGAGEIVANSASLFTVETGAESELELLRREYAFPLLQEEPELAAELTRKHARHSCRLLRSIMKAGKHQARQTLWNTLLELVSAVEVSRGDRSLQIPIRDLSAQIGCSRQWTSRLLRELEEEGKIRQKEGWVIVRGNGV
jgi:CRP-like cAMP-binding protein